MHAYPQSGIIFRPKFVAYRWWDEYVRGRLWKQLDYAINVLPKEWNATEREGHRNEAEGPSLMIHSYEGYFVKKKASLALIWDA